MGKGGRICARGRVSKARSAGKRSHARMQHETKAELESARSRCTSGVAKCAAGESVQAQEKSAREKGRESMCVYG